MTYIELVDTALKIGLGALIAGFFALLSSRRQHNQELDRARMMRRERVLEMVLEEFEMAYQSLSRKYEEVLAMAQILSVEKYRIHAKKSIYGTSDFPRLHIVESRLLLLGLKEEARYLMGFRQIAGEFEKMALPKDRSHPDPDALNLKLEKLFSQRASIYERLSGFYDDPGKRE